MYNTINVIGKLRLPTLVYCLTFLKYDWVAHRKPLDFHVILQDIFLISLYQYILQQMSNFHFILSYNFKIPTYSAQGYV